VWEAVQHLVRALHAEDGGAAAAAALLARMGGKAQAAGAEAAGAEAARAEAARALADRLFRLATDRGWAQEALAYNHLAEEWPDLLDRAADIGQGRQHTGAGDLFAPA
jgi:putative DNA methylase